MVCVQCKKFFETETGHVMPARRVRQDQNGPCDYTMEAQPWCAPCVVTYLHQYDPGYLDSFLPWAWAT